jgi:hypothetical protein
MPATAAASHHRRVDPIARGGVRSESHDPDSPHNGQADALCRVYAVVCKAPGNIRCNLLVLVLSKENKAIAAALSPVCAKPAEARRTTYCNSMIAPLLEDDPKNCGACGASCGGDTAAPAGASTAGAAPRPPASSACSVPVCVEKDTPTIWLDTAELSR